jgi:hypothetical protein
VNYSINFIVIGWRIRFQEESFEAGSGKVILVAKDPSGSGSALQMWYFYFIPDHFMEILGRLRQVLLVRPRFYEFIFCLSFVSFVHTGFNVIVRSCYYFSN